MEVIQIKRTNSDLNGDRGRNHLFCHNQTTEDMLSKSPRCNDMMVDLHFPRFFGTPIQYEIARRFPRSVVKVGLNDQCKNISILSGAQP